MQKHRHGNEHTSRHNCCSCLWRYHHFSFTEQLHWLWQSMENPGKRVRLSFNTAWSQCKHNMQQRCRRLDCSERSLWWLAQLRQWRWTPTKYGAFLPFKLLQRSWQHSTYSHTLYQNPRVLYTKCSGQHYVKPHCVKILVLQKCNWLHRKYGHTTWLCMFWNLANDLSHQDTFYSTSQCRCSLISELQLRTWHLQKEIPEA